MVYAALIATTMLWGGAFVAIKQALRYLNPLELLFMRVVPSALAFAVLLYVKQRGMLSELLRAEWRSLCLMGLFGGVSYHLTLNTGQQLIPAGTASVIVAMNPVFILLLSVWFLRQRVRWGQVLGLCIAFVGLFIVIRFAGGSHIDFGYLRGVLVTLGAPLSWAAYTLISGPLAARYTPLAVTGMGLMLGALPILCTSSPSLFHALAAMPWDGWASTAFLSLLCTVVGVTMWVTALRHLEASRVAVFHYLVPVWGVVLSRLLLDEPLTEPVIIGALVVILGVVLVNRDATLRR